jgi:hypothetical protein
MSRMLSAPSSPHAEHRRHKQNWVREGRLRQIHRMTREQQEALVEEARAARLRGQQRPEHE